MVPYFHYRLESLTRVLVLVHVALHTRHSNSNQSRTPPPPPHNSTHPQTQTQRASSEARLVQALVSIVEVIMANDIWINVTSFIVDTLFVITLVILRLSSCFLLCRSRPDLLTCNIGNNAKAPQNLALSLESF